MPTVQTDLPDDEDDEKTPLNDCSGQDVKNWDVFVVTQPKDEDETVISKAVDITLKAFKLLIYLLTFCVVLGSAVISKGTLLFMTSNIKGNKNPQVCKRGLGLDRDKDYEVFLPEFERIPWIWSLFLALIVPELFALFRSTRICVFKSYKKPKLFTFISLFIGETLYAVGLSLLVFIVLPDLDVIKAAMLTNCVCFIPSVLGLLSRHSGEAKRPVKVIFDILAILIQGTSFVLWPMTEKTPRAWLIPISVTLVSARWWENYVDKNSPFSFLRKLSSIKEDLRKSRYFISIFLSLWKMIVIFCAMFGFLHLTMDDATFIFRGFTASFRSHPIMVQQLRLPLQVLSDIPTASPLDEQVFLMSSALTPIYVALIQVAASLMCYVFGKFACKICIQGFSFAFPINLTIPVCISMLIASCGVRTEDVCFFEAVLPKYLFWTCPQGNFFQDFVSSQYAWIWLLWLLSQIWITVHIWTPKCERLASTEKLFVNPMYCGALIDQSVALNRRRDDEGEIKSEELDLEGNNEENDISQYYETISIQTETSSDPAGKNVRNSDHITRIYACATMWHETTEEMLQMLKSVLRMDEDQCARRNAQKYLRIVDPDYYEFEVHIFFDDAYELCDDDDEEMVVNRFVKQLIQVMDTAASNVHQCNIRLKPPKKIPTPYGGRLQWIMPGRNKLIAHLKDKGKIRHRKRWSQVMYMYYLLGHRLIELPIDVNRKATMAENTFVLALDGDINFRPHAVQLLVDLMKKNRNLGAACGRIHPVGSGPMVWYQKFEYAIGHWLQKATEHMIGCVLCSPGCFSLFRAKALMDDNVMRKYTTRSDEARHYVQYDQGEDRWLCTLLLQRGYRVEYSAASDAYTHCPEGFGEFYTQRRRWAPSTMANIMDLLSDYKATVAVNDNISLPYVVYQGMLMTGTVLGPGTIFLMLVGAMVAAFKISNWNSFTYNIIPILLFMAVCFIFKNDIQIMVAQVMSAAYALLMMAVLVGTSIQLTEDGLGSPSSIFLIALSGSFFIAALLHPQEFWCVFPGLLYFLSIPSMYLLLIIYSLVNLNVVTWGTREVQTKKTKKEVEEERKEQEELLKKKKNTDLLSFLGIGSKDNEEGSITLSLANLFTCMLCTYPKSNEDKLHLVKIGDQLEQMNKKVTNLERQLELSHVIPFKSRRTSVVGRGSVRAPSEAGLSVVNENEDEEAEFESDSDLYSNEGLEPKQERDDLINPYWIEDKELKRGEVEYLAASEIQFWKDLIDKYLYPIEQNKEHQARVASELKELRNKVVFAFFMFNALFILIVFLLQLNKDQLHLDWPLGVKTNITYNPETSEVHIEKEYLELEPIGLVFAVFFALILVIQFVAMLFHRFGTLSHIMASIELSCWNQKVDDISDDAFIDKNAVQIARQLQRLRGIDDDESIYGDRLAKRKTIQNLEKRKNQRDRIGTLDVAFRKRFMNLHDGENGHIATPVLNGLNKIGRSRETIRALELRRNHLLGNNSRMETLGAKNDFNARNKNGRPKNNDLRRVFAKPNGGIDTSYGNKAFDPDDISLQIYETKNSLTERRRQSHL
ncbi:chitin synthase chs-2 [Parasteatoda tepidariorum]|uniref:chitin synthase chs-2 n=1 Tax=Parasteatoda tepidariorum TaxID=114398 RepID=UPI001C71F9AD|nr:chitin synthase chs-2 [Parasteatoda tepidariorum]XP_042909494.1 chitin synthase chs-2 [Parasteatoda tepidariorum]